MSRVFWEDFFASPAFSELLVINQNFILDKMFAPSPIETISIGNVASETAAPKVVSMEAPAPVPTVPRLPGPKPTLPEKPS